jgi:ornithine--oxo-acid transaminase
MQETKTAEHLRIAEQYGAHNYHPLPVVIESGEGSWVTDVDGKRYLDMLSAYSALNFGYSNERLIAAATKQLNKVTLTSRAFHNDQLGPFCKELCELSGYSAVLPMNSGAEAVETAVKMARKWGYTKKGIEANKAEVICAEGNFHGRTTTVISFSTDKQYRDGFGPFTPGFPLVPFGDIKALGKGHQQAHRRFPGRADPGGERDQSPAGRLSPTGTRDLHQEQNSVPGGRDSDRPVPHR